MSYCNVINLPQHGFLPCDFCVNQSLNFLNATNKLFISIDIVAATSVLHLKAAEIRNEKIKWQSYLE